MAFRKVRYRKGPKHLFYVAEETLRRWPSKYTEADKELYASPGATELADSQQETESPKPDPKP